MKLAPWKNAIYDQSANLENFMALLMKQRNRKGNWTPADLSKLREQIKCISVSVPFLIFLVFPGGMVMLPLLASALDRRKEMRCP